MQHRLDRADAQRDRALRTRAHLALDLALQREQPLRMVEEAHAGHGEAELLVAPVEQQHAELFFERRDPARHRRLRDVQLLGRARHALQRHDPVEGFDKSQVHDDSIGKIDDALRRISV
jgi:hypothetical protein